jgi:serine-type D-Ala-D-Ala carboxypeptidase (penicillin-binding protein 5/6)
MPGVLQGGQRRRPRRRSRAPLAALLLVVLTVVTVLLLNSGAHIETKAVQTTTAPVVGSRAPRATPGFPPVPVYGRRRAPVQVHVTFKKPPRAALLWDAHTGRVLYARDPALRLRVASLTKMMTAIVVNDHSAARERVLVTKQALAYQGSGVGILPKGKHIRLETMLYGLLLPSGNDAAIALAQHVAGTIGAFIGKMNADVRRFGLGCTHYTSVSGFRDSGNFSCAYDLAFEAGQMLRRPRLARIIATRDAVLPFPTKGGKLYLANNNPLLRMRYPGTIGVKTGFTDAAGRCLVAVVRRGKRELGAVVLNSTDPQAQVRKLFYYGFRARGGP